MAKRITVPAVLSRKGGRSVVMVTAYDATFARLFDSCDVDILLVGDSLGMVVQGHDTTIPVTLDHMIYHTQAVARVTQRALVCADLPFMTTKRSPQQALEEAAALMQQGGAHAVKFEGGQTAADTIARMVSAGIPVMGHVGMTPQWVHAYGGFKIQGRKDDAAQRIVDDAVAVAQAGAFAIVLEGIPGDLAHRITDTVPVPTIGIGAGPHCDGQVLVGVDLLGLNEEFTPRFVKRFADLAPVVRTAVDAFADAVREGRFPAEEHTVWSRNQEDKA